jgi:hypothetical protein
MNMPRTRAERLGRLREDNTGVERGWRKNAPLQMGACLLSDPSDSMSTVRRSQAQVGERLTILQTKLNILSNIMLALTEAASRSLLNACVPLHLPGRADRIY